MKSGWGQWLLVAGLSLALAGSYLTWRSPRGGPLPAGDISSVTELRDGSPLPAFVLRGPNGEFTNANLLGRWSFMFFGYTHCPDICPTALTLMKEIKAALAAQTVVSPAPSQGIPLRITFQVVFVSVDPRRDTPELLGEYVAAFDPAFIGVSGNDAELAPLTGKLGSYYRRNDGADTRRYTADHSAAIYLLDPQGRLAAVFSPPRTAARMVADFQRIARR